MIISLQEFLIGCLAIVVLVAIVIGFLRRMASCLWPIVSTIIAILAIIMLMNLITGYWHL